MRKNVIGILLTSVTVASFALAGCNRSGTDDQQRSESNTGADVVAGGSPAGNVGAPSSGTGNNAANSPTDTAGAPSSGTGNSTSGNDSSAGAADSDRPTAAAGTSPAQGDEEDTNASQQYSAELQKCDALQGSERTRCVDNAKRKHGQM